MEFQLSIRAVWRSCQNILMIHKSWQSTTNWLKQRYSTLVLSIQIHLSSKWPSWHLQHGIHTHFKPLTFLQHLRNQTNDERNSKWRKQKINLQHGPHSKQNPIWRKSCNQVNDNRVHSWKDMYECNQCITCVFANAEPSHTKLIPLCAHSSDHDLYQSPGVQMPSLLLPGFPASSEVILQCCVPLGGSSPPEAQYPPPQGSWIQSGMHVQSQCRWPLDDDWWQWRSTSWESRVVLCVQSAF